MEMQAGKSLHPLIWVAAIVLIVFCGAGAAALMGWIPGSAGNPTEVRLAATKAPLAKRCAECAVVQSVHETQTKGDGSGIGVVGGAAVGGVLGNQVGHGDGRRVATVVGAVGGAVVGNEIEKRVRSTKSYEITVRFEDGSSRVITEADATAWRAGDKVKIINGVIHANS
jgi:outer membrane lipoprotein SlyB